MKDEIPLLIWPFKIYSSEATAGEGRAPTYLITLRLAMCATHNSTEFLKEFSGQLLTDDHRTTVIDAFAMVFIVMFLIFSCTTECGK